MGHYTGESEEERSAETQDPAQLAGADCVAGRGDRPAESRRELHRRLHSWQDFDRCKPYRSKIGDVNAGFLGGFRAGNKQLQCNELLFLVKVGKEP
jgi:hypothetical protein